MMLHLLLFALALTGCNGFTAHPSKQLGRPMALTPGSIGQPLTKVNALPEAFTNNYEVSYILIEHILYPGEKMRLLPYCTL